MRSMLQVLVMSLVLVSTQSVFARGGADIGSGGLNAAEGDFSAVELAQILSNPSVARALNSISGGSDVSVTAEPFAAMESAGVQATITVSGRLDLKGKALPNCRIIAEVFTDKTHSELDKSILKDLRVITKDCSADQ